MHVINNLFGIIPQGQALENMWGAIKNNLALEDIPNQAAKIWALARRTFNEAGGPALLEKVSASIQRNAPIVAHRVQELWTATFPTQLSSSIGLIAVSIISLSIAHRMMRRVFSISSFAVGVLTGAVGAHYIATHATE